MATFPALRPGTRTYIAASYPGAVHTAYGGQESRVRTSNANSGARLRLQFPGISEAQMLEIASHYAGQRGRFYPFQLSGEVLSGVTNPNTLTPAGYQWIYASSPKITDISEGTAASPRCIHDVELELELVPEVSTFAGGARWVATASIRSGIVASGNITLAGASWSVVAAMDGGNRTGIASGAAWTATAAIAGGAASNGNSTLLGAAWVAAATIGGGGIVTNTSATGAAWSVTAAIAGGAASVTAATDPNFSSVSLLLHMDGSNGSTTFTDNSSAARTITRFGNAQISTAQSKWGGASALFDGNGDYLTAPTNTAFAFSGDFTVEAWIRISTNPAPTFSIFDTGNDASREFGLYLYLNSSRQLVVLRNFVNRITTSAAVPTGQWVHVALTRSSGVWRLFIDGTVNTTTYTSTLDLTTGACIIGGSVQTILGGSSQGWFDGYIDDVRITKGVARYTATFTPPTAAFPDS
jgi:hypothetical protein